MEEQNRTAGRIKSKTSLSRVEDPCRKSGMPESSKKDSCDLVTMPLQTLYPTNLITGPWAEVGARAAIFHEISFLNYVMEILTCGSLEEQVRLYRKNRILRILSVSGPERSCK